MRDLIAASVTLALLLGTGAVGAAEDAQGPETEAQATAGATASPDEQALEFTFEPVEGRSFESWIEVGRAPGSDGYMTRLRVLDGRLLAAGRWMPAGEAFERSNRAWFSDDGWTWTATTLPGASPQVNDLEVRPDGSMAIAVGYSADDWTGAIWVTSDGVEWQAARPPSKGEVDAVAVSDEVVAVSAGYRLWTTTDLDEWRRVKGPGTVSGVAYGPGGFLATEGGGQDLISETAVWHSADGIEWAKVKLPKALRNASVGVSVFPFDEEWLLVPDKRGLMYRSTDGRRWRQVPRPPGLTEGYVVWMLDLGEAVQAEGHLFRRRNPGSGVWTFVPGEPVAKPKSAPEGFIRTDAPVAWDDGYLGVGSMEGEGPDTTVLTLWRREVSGPEQAAGDPWPSTVLPDAQDVAAAHDRFVVVGTTDQREPRATSWSSTDGLEWIQAPASSELEGATMSRVIGTDDGFVAMGSDEQGRIVAWHSPDGLSWERGELERAGRKRMDGYVIDVVDGPAGLLALGIFIGEDDGGHRLWRSADGRTWTALDGPDEIIPDLGVVPGIELSFSLIAVPDGYWLVGRGGGQGDVSVVWRSEDGSSWKRLKRLSWLVDAAASEDGTVAAISGTDIRATDDLRAWRNVWTFPKVDVYLCAFCDIDWDGTRFVTAGTVAWERCPGGGRCPLHHWLTSTDGRTWTASSGPDGEPGPDRDFLVTTASLADRTVALGWSADDEPVVWLADAPPAEDA